MPEYILRGDQEGVIGGVANVVAGLTFSKVCFAESDVRGAMRSDGIYKARPILPGPEITLTPIEDGSRPDMYTLNVNGDGQDSTGNVTKANELVKRHLAAYFVQ